MSIAARPQLIASLSCAGTRATSQLFEPLVMDAPVSTVPGVTIRVTARSTKPADPPCDGGTDVCSAIATL